MSEEEMRALASLEASAQVKKPTGFIDIEYPEIARFTHEQLTQVLFTTIKKTSLAIGENS